MHRALPLLLLLAACGGEEEAPPAVERSFVWEAPEGSTVAGAVALAGGDTFITVTGPEGTAGLFLSETGEVVSEVALGPLCEDCDQVHPALPLALGGDAFFGAAGGGAPAFLVDGERRTVRHLPIYNPRGLPLGPFYLDGSRGTRTANGDHLLLPGERVVELSIEGIVTAVHVTPPMETLAHVQEDTYGFLNGDGTVGGWKKGERDVQLFEGLRATALAGGDGFTVLALRQGMALELFAWADPLRSLEATFLHEVALSVAPRARRVLVGVQATPLVDDLGDEEVADDRQPGALLVLDEEGQVLGTFEAPAPVASVHLATEGTHGVAAWSGGVMGLQLR